MPELPEVETVVRTLAPHLAGRRILDARFTSHFVVPGRFEDLARRVRGRTILAVRRHGKFILIELDDGVLAIHLGMTGRLLVDARPTPHTYAVFSLDGSVLLYDDIRQFGKIEWSRNLPACLARLGPEPLALDFPQFWERLHRRKARVKPLLLNQAFLRGLGNIYADEALFRSGVHPRAIASRLSLERAQRLHQAIRDTLTLAIEHGGSSISDYVDAEGKPGTFQLLHQVYGREGAPCPKCGAPVRRIVVAQRGTHYCPKCQR